MSLASPPPRFTASRALPGATLIVVASLGFFGVACGGFPGLSELSQPSGLQLIPPDAPAPVLGLPVRRGGAVARMLSTTKDIAVRSTETPAASPHDVSGCQRVSDKTVEQASQEGLVAIVTNAKAEQVSVMVDEGSEIHEMWTLAPMNQGGTTFDAITHLIEPDGGGTTWRAEAWGCFPGLRWVQTPFGGEFMEDPSLIGRPWRRNGTGWGLPPVATEAATPSPASQGLSPSGEEADPEVAWLEDSRRRAEDLARNHPSRTRASIRAEFDQAPRDPVGDDATLADLYRVLRDVDRCDPRSAGYSLSQEALRVMKNTPFAMHGYSFSAPELDAVFRKEPWYEPNQSVNGAHPPALDGADEACVKKLKALGAQ